MTSVQRKIQKDSPYVTDESKISGTADDLFIPENEEDVVTLVAAHNTKKTPITTSGMRTGMCGGSVPFGGDVLTTEKLNKVFGIGKDDRGYFIRLQPAVTIRELNEIIRKKDYSKLTNITENAKESMSEKDDYFYPVDPTELNSSIGGNIAANSSGPRTLKYGPTRDWIRRIRVVIADGTALDIKRGDILADGRIFHINIGGQERAIPIPSYHYNTNVKNSTGIMAYDNMDLVDLFVGSEGIFGVITEADVYITKWHPLMSNIFFFPDDDSSYSFVKAVQASEIHPEFLEYFDSGSLDLIRATRKKDPKLNSMPDIPDYAGSAVFMDLPLDNELMSKYAKLEKMATLLGGSLDNSWCGHEKRDRERFFEFRHSVPKTIFEYVAGLKGTSPGIHKMGTDMSVPLENLDTMMNYYRSVLKKYDLEYVIFGHIGNGHLHVEIILKNIEDMEKAKKAYKELAVKAIELKGSPSAEHGIGKIKRDYVELMYGKEGVEEIKRTKNALDPNWIFCPGNMVER